MYQPKHFEENRPEVLRAVVRQHPLALLVTLSDTGLQADPVPLLWREDAQGQVVLAGHVARANPLWQRTRLDTDVLAVFQGPQHYISPSWYASKAAGGRVVPAWNYATVHAWGRARLVNDADWLMAQLNALTHAQERHQPHPWAVADAPADYLSGMLRAIVGVEVCVERLQGKWKVSQNRPVADRHTVHQGLLAQVSPHTHPAQAMAKLVAQHLPSA